MIGDLPLLSAIKSRMQFHQARQKMLAENVANADTPGYRPRDLKPFDLMMAMQKQSDASQGPTRTHAGHIGGGGGAGGAIGNRRASVFESTPSGNAVNLEDEMMRLAQNNSDYQMATTLYSKSLGYLRLALGKRA
jgi:flagellar basal-body rod protein FlgB